MRDWERDHLYQRPDFVVPFRMIIAPFVRQARLFIEDMGFYPPECRIAREPKDLRGYRLDTWEVWWLDRLWPCHTHEDVQAMVGMQQLARVCGADLRRWWT
ncbi:hypothetical protein [Streptomyces sp. NPDC015131]|uniref:hypothetical protein n=1 Tax=Streptomyces sp. NPDC015131 TaxID=3364941 RepID=UPI0036F6BB5C